MKVELVPNWKRVLKRSWAVCLAGIIEMLHADVTAALPFLQQYLAEGTAGLLAAFSGLMVPVVRIIKQVSLAVDQAIEQSDTQG
jgi:hypothetical protein